MHRQTQAHHACSSQCVNPRIVQIQWERRQDGSSRRGNCRGEFFNCRVCRKEVRTKAGCCCCAVEVRHSEHCGAACRKVPADSYIDSNGGEADKMSGTACKDPGVRARCSMSANFGRPVPA
jgi:hypothetical protein